MKNISIEYNSVELYPLSPERMLNILNGFKDRVGDRIDTLVEAYRKVDITVAGWNSMKIQQPFGTLELNLWIGEALEMVNALEKPCDVWILDGHSPKKNLQYGGLSCLRQLGKRQKLEVPVPLLL